MAGTCRYLARRGESPGIQKLHAHSVIAHIYQGRSPFLSHRRTSRTPPISTSVISIGLRSSGTHANCPHDTLEVSSYAPYHLPIGPSSANSEIDAQTCPNSGLRIFALVESANSSFVMCRIPTIAMRYSSISRISIPIRF